MPRPHPGVHENGSCGVPLIGTSEMPRPACACAAVGSGTRIPRPAMSHADRSLEGGGYGEAGAVLFLTVIFQRMRFKYQDRAYRYGLLEAGHLGQNVYLAATWMGCVPAASGPSWTTTTRCSAWTGARRPPCTCLRGDPAGRLTPARRPSRPPVSSAPSARTEPRVARRLRRRAWALRYGRHCDGGGAARHQR